MGIPSNLARAKQLAVYWDNYVNYLSTVDDRQPNIGQGTPKPPQTKLYLIPFDKDLAANQYLEANGTASRWSTFGASFAGYTKATLAGTDTTLNIRFTPARVVIKTGLSTTKQVVTAKTTKRKYITYGGEAGSIPFGTTGAQEELDAYNDIKTKILALPAFQAQTMKVSRIREKIA